MLSEIAERLRTATTSDGSRSRSARRQPAHLAERSGRERPLGLSDEERREGEAILRDRYRWVMGCDLNLDNPQRFIDKLYERMIVQHHDPDPRFTRLTDKYRARQYVRRRVGKGFLVPLYWHGTDPAQIPFGHLPRRLVVKSNHACDQVLRMDADLDRSEVVTTAQTWMSEDYYYKQREVQYLGIRPRVLVEAYLDDGFAEGPLDYRFYCFAGEPVFIQVSDHAHAVHVFFDTRWRPLAMRFRPDRATYDVPRPAGLDEMVRVASRLSTPFDFVRVDLYDIGGDVRFGEMTFTPQAGWRVFQPDSVEWELGHRWRTAQAGSGRSWRRRPSSTGRLASIP